MNAEEILLTIVVILISPVVCFIILAILKFIANTVGDILFCILAIILVIFFPIPFACFLVFLTITCLIMSIIGYIYEHLEKIYNR
jgi:hypothetical protein